MSTTATKVSTKKVVKKAAAKKAVSVSKVTVKKKSTVKTLVVSDNSHSFWSSDGQIFNSLTALHDALKKMDKSVYLHHAGKDKNDFAEWVEVVLGDAACAADLRKAKTQSGARSAIAKHLKTYKI